MKLTFDVANKTQPDPFIFEDGDDLYLYVTAEEGVEVYWSDDLFGEWIYKGVVTEFENAKTFWAPSVIKLDGVYYLYVSCIKDGHFQHLHVASAESPLGPFRNAKRLYDHFSIDSHMVQTKSGLFMWYAKNNRNCKMKGTHVYVDRFLDPLTPANDPREMLVPDFDEEKFTPSCTADENWYTLEGPFWFREGEWQYLMYSAGCYLDDTYHIGYAVARSDEEDLLEVAFTKATDNGGFCPLIIKNDFEEGTGHHSVIKYKGEYYAIYHGRDYTSETVGADEERRTARVCHLIVCDGKIKAERTADGCFGV